MVKKYKSVLEKYNEGLKPRRLPTPEEEAIEPVYPEEYLAGGPGKFAALGIRPSARKTKDVFKEIKKQESLRADPRLSKEGARYRIAQTRIGERAIDIDEVKDQLKSRAELKNRPMYKEVFGKDEAKLARQNALGKIAKTTERSTDKATKNFLGEAGTLIGGEVYRQNENAAGDTYKKGGEVKSRARRIDGCAIKGKTKGRMI